MDKDAQEIKNTNQIPVPLGSRKNTKRLGRGPSSGKGKTCGRGQKGQKARAASMKRGFEGGQMPLHRRLPKRGFTSKFRIYYQPVNLGDIAKFKLSGDIDIKTLFKHGLIRDENSLVKILAQGEIDDPVNIVADKYSKAALEKVQSKGGKIIVRELNKAKEK
ncbi:MAG: 50S ribosomal protein L15 [Leptospiraceae bacterium]|nr:50S ribosomal protein L15 [Leptospiraceae bacterium]MCP5496658.1 50S ribosomal protein L15 [Leptospiraceae bacterium]